MDMIRLKGGSLSATWLVDEGERRLIRKDVSTVENREYGFYRWFSQLKKLQRLQALHPDLFPAVVDIGATEDKAWFDLAYVEGSVTLFDFLASNPPNAEVDASFDAFMAALDTLHRPRRASFRGGIDLYLSQEVDRALAFCMEEPDFRAFTRHPRLVFNGESVVPLLARIEQLRELARKHYVTPWETDTHGNVTLENTLYVPADKRIVFIDVYEENFVDNVYNEYSQVLQSCSSCYELYNSREARVDGPEIELRLEPHPALDRFDARFGRTLQDRCTGDELVMVRLYEISQFTRMLPFKRHVARDKMIFFYGLASLLFDRLCRDL